MKQENRGGSRRWLYIVVPLAVVALVAAGVLAGRAAVMRQANEAVEAARAEAEAAISNANAEKDENGRIGYETNVITSDPETLQAAVDEMYEKAAKNAVALEYKDIATSDDGQHFSCYLANSAENSYDMFFAIYADNALTDQLFLSKLLRPGTRLEEIELERTLEPGTHTGYVVYTQVEDEEDDVDQSQMQVIHNQVATTINLIVNE